MEDKKMGIGTLITGGVIFNSIKDIFKKFSLPLSLKYIKHTSCDFLCSDYISDNLNIKNVDFVHDKPEVLMFYLLYKDIYHIQYGYDKYHYYRPDNGVYIRNIDPLNTVITFVTDNPFFRNKENYSNATSKPTSDTYYDIHFIGKDAHKHYNRWLKKSMCHAENCITQMHRDSHSIVKSSNGYSTMIKPKRLFDIIIPDEKKKMVLNEIYQFLKSKDLRDKYNIPYKLGIFIYGPPGTGKSSFVYSLAKKLNINILVVSRDDILQKNCRTHGFGAHNGYDISSMYLIEEIDSIIDSSAYIKEKENERGNMIQIKKQDLLEWIDNISYGSILIATSNVKLNEVTGTFDEIDDAIIRPGRFDIRFEMGPFERPEAIKMIKQYDLQESFADSFEYPITPSKLEFECIQEVTRINMKTKEEL